jgi:hypothetical protein
MRKLAFTLTAALLVLGTSALTASAQTSSSVRQACRRSLTMPRRSSRQPHAVVSVITVVASENYIRAYRWCRPPRIG